MVFVVSGWEKSFRDMPKNVEGEKREKDINNVRFMNQYHCRLGTINILVMNIVLLIFFWSQKTHFLHYFAIIVQHNIPRRAQNTCHPIYMDFAALTVHVTRTVIPHETCGTVPQCGTAQTQNLEQGSGRILCRHSDKVAKFSLFTKWLWNHGGYVRDGWWNVAFCHTITGLWMKMPKFLIWDRLFGTVLSCAICSTT